MVSRACLLRSVKQASMTRNWQKCCKTELTRRWRDQYEATPTLRFHSLSDDRLKSAGEHWQLSATEGSVARASRAELITNHPRPACVRMNLTERLHYAACLLDSRRRIWVLCSQPRLGPCCKTIESSCYASAGWRVAGCILFRPFLGETRPLTDWLSIQPISAHR